MIIVGLVTILNFYKSVIKRDKDIANARRSFNEKQKIEQQLLEAELAAFNHALLTRKMLEYDDRCYDVHALIYRPSDYDHFIEFEENVFLEVNVTADRGNDVVARGEIVELNRENNTKNYVGLKEKESKSAKLPEKADTSSIVYVLVAILLGSLIKAALDLTKHYKKVKRCQSF